MRRTTFRSLTWGAACAAVMAACGIATGQEQEAQTAPPVLALNSAGIDAILSSPKDRALRDLLHMVAPRLAELPVELDRLGVDRGVQIPPGTFETLWLIGSRPQALELRLNLARLRNQEVPVDVRWAALTDDPQAATDAIGFARTMLRDAPLRVRAGAQEGQFVAETQAIPVYFGSRAGDEPMLFISTEESALPAMDASYVDLPEGVEQVMGLRFDLGQLTPVIGMPIGMAPPIVGELLMEAGLVGWDATRFDFAIGYSDTTMHSVARMTGAARAARLFATDTDRTLTKADFRMVPGDATMASLGFYDASRTWDLAVRVMERMGVWEQVRAELRQELDLDTAVVESVVRSLGDTWVSYQSESTGGGEFSSLILSVSVRDRAALEQALRTGIEKFNAIGRNEGRGYARVRSWDREGTRVYSIHAPGLPIPIEPTFAISGDRLLVAMSAPSFLAALDQHQKGLRSLAERADIRALAGGSFDGIAGFSYTDTARYARRGYGSLNHLMAALANGVRSPLSDREPYETAAMMPSYSEFTRDIVPMVAVMRWDGEDLIVSGVADRSISVHLAAGLGKTNLGAISGQILPMMFTGGMTTFGSAHAEAQDAAVQARSLMQVRTATMAATAYASEQGRGLPASVDELIESGAIEHSGLRSPYGSMMDGVPDIVIRTDLAGSEPDHSTRTVLAIDRSALEFAGATAVGFMDGHIEWLHRAEIERLMELPANTGARDAFGF